MDNQSPIGITGGTGVYEIPELEILESVAVDTPFGEPSDEYIRGNLKGVDIVFLPRHGRGHLYSAPGVNYRANIYGFKKLGVDSLLATGAVGSMREEHHPTDIVIPDQFFDNTGRRVSTFFTGSPAIHVDLADPTCPALREIIYRSGLRAGASIKNGGTYICIDGPAFSTRAESEIYRSWGMDIIGMSGATEAKLCREAEMCYVSLALVTDYDVWKEGAEDVTVDVIVANLLKNAQTARAILKEAILNVPGNRGCSCRNALDNAIVGDINMVSDESRARLGILVDRHMPPKVL
ncbi:MAG: S-methyl-5'-thioadenosine phosphorylase [Actinobacteria bacterium]|nr:S-methyl-5'-thioadenosine phosphorylase [Actinomycetota bacterium]MCG2818542.1 S-methyl-5'-thioadenosine phosphorylase [Actinomycetes bacterium]MBU4179175.1 S-methyl-5'-thioadenosine phosphorylase [Actinomycetota bacterium]MBU4218269.1 S-methyl-5'-thioadenosine phosphorylase [Actinomycetota bacterium]MBU4358694.1 S-methyl-5'-thioadenosine phosphorylase [Actinomycetota bacterium]